MIIQDLLKPDAFKMVCEIFDRLKFTDGAETATDAAKSIKRSKIARGERLGESGEIERDQGRNDLIQAQHTIAAALMSRDDVQAWARPKNLIAMQLVRYDQGDGYDWHVDNAIMNGFRTDISFTYFINDPGEYGIGTLDIRDNEERMIKLPANWCFLYPASSLHRVCHVDGGTRKVAVGWIESYVRTHEQRELLFDLDSARSELFAQHGRTQQHELLTKTEMNLLRMWSS